MQLNLRKQTAMVMAWTMISAGRLQAENDDPFAADRKIDPEIASYRTPDHLIPIDRITEDWAFAYEKQLKKYLNLDASYLVRMIVRPSFDAEYTVSVYGDSDSYEISASKEFFVSYTVVNRNIWYARSQDNQEKIEKPIQPKTLKASIPAAVAKRVCAIWDEMILGTHYPREDSVGFDGVTIEFMAHRGRGETRSPTEGTSPALLKDLGESLINYCKADEKERKQRLDAIGQSASKLESYLKKQAKPVEATKPAK